MFLKNVFIRSDTTPLAIRINAPISEPRDALRKNTRGERPERRGETFEPQPFP